MSCAGVAEWVPPCMLHAASSMPPPWYTSSHTPPHQPHHLSPPCPHPLLRPHHKSKSSPPTPPAACPQVPPGTTKTMSPAAIRAMWECICTDYTRHMGIQLETPGSAVRDAEVMVQLLQRPAAELAQQCSSSAPACARGSDGAGVQGGQVAGAGAAAASGAGRALLRLHHRRAGARGGERQHCCR